MVRAKKLPPKTDEPLPEIGRRVRRARRELGLTQAKLGERVGVDQSAITRFERGERGLEAGNLVGLFQHLAELGIDVDGFIIRGVGEPMRRNLTLVAANPELAAALRVLADGLEKDRGERGPADEGPRPGDKR